MWCQYLLTVHKGMLGCTNTGTPSHTPHRTLHLTYQPQTKDSYYKNKPTTLIQSLHIITSPLSLSLSHTQSPFSLLVCVFIVQTITSGTTAVRVCHSDADTAYVPHTMCRPLVHQTGIHIMRRPLVHQTGIQTMCRPSVQQAYTQCIAH